MAEQIVFFIISAFTLIMGIFVVTNRNLFRAALAMMGSFFGVAGMYALLEAGFMAAAQLLVYIGAISILVIFAIMLTRNMMQTDETPFNSQSLLGLLTAVITFAILFLTFFQMRAFWPLEPSANVPYASRPEVPAEVIEKSVEVLGAGFVDPNGFVLPFEVASVLLLAAMVGAILIAWPPDTPLGGGEKDA